jgi:hypothetical protein
MDKAGPSFTTTAPRFDAQMLPPLARIAAVIEVPEGGTLEATRADFARVLQLVDLGFSSPTCRK